MKLPYGDAFTANTSRARSLSATRYETSHDASVRSRRLANRAAAAAKTIGAPGNTTGNRFVVKT